MKSLKKLLKNLKLSNKEINKLQFNIAHNL